MRASHVLKGYADATSNLHPNQGRIRRLSADPFVAVGVVGDPKLPFILVLPEGTIDSEISGENLRVRSSMDLSLHEEGSGENLEMPATAILFREVTPASLRFLDILVDTALAPNGTSQLDSLARDFIDLFAKRTSLSREQVTGLFGEILVIAVSRDPGRMLAAWHREDEAAYDFSRENDRLEVKTSELNRRHHTFSSNQLPLPPGIAAYAVSILANETPGGQTLVDLIREVEEILGADPQLLEFQRRVWAKVSHDFDLCSSLQFDTEMARSSLQLYDLSQVPLPGHNPMIIRAKWTIDFEQAVPVSMDGIHVLGELPRLLSRE
jgi:hypothetical protein